jgi:hypothetical protein
VRNNHKVLLTALQNVVIYLLMNTLHRHLAIYARSHIDVHDYQSVYVFTIRHSLLTLHDRLLSRQSLVAWDSIPVELFPQRQ